MNKKILLLIGVFLLSLTYVSAQEVDNDDTQFWNETTVEFPLDADNNKVSGIVIGNLRVTDNISDLSDKRLGFAVKYKATKNLTIQPSYLFRLQTSSGPNRYEHRLRLDITPQKSWKKFSVENRSRFEHRFKTNGRDDDTFYRNRTKLKIPVKNSSGKTIITPFVSNDTYFDIQDPRVYRNDSAGGISRKVSNNLTTDFFYQYRRNFQSGTKNIHVIGVNLKFKVD
jgi:hypothetical protein